MGGPGAGGPVGTATAVVAALCLGLAPGLGAQDSTDGDTDTTETVAAAVARSVAAYGSLAAADGEARTDGGDTETAVVDSVSTGQITLFRADGSSSAFNVTFTRKGDGQMQRVIHQPGRGGAVGDRRDPALAFLEHRDVGGGR